MSGCGRNTGQDAAIKPENKPIKTLKTRSSVFAAGLFVSEKQQRKKKHNENSWHE